MFILIKSSYVLLEGHGELVRPGHASRSNAAAEVLLLKCLCPSFIQSVCLFGTLVCYNFKYLC